MKSLPSRISVLRTLGTPYPEWTEEQILGAAGEQASKIAQELRVQGRYAAPGKEIVALIAYLQKLGKSQPVERTVSAK